MHPVQEELSLREQKRLETRLRIEDAATELVDKHSFGEVTIEEICELAGISRRTFFNYFDSKESAVLGAPSADFTAEMREYFLHESTSSIMELVLNLVEQHMEGHHVNPTIRERRKRIANDPEAAAASISRKRAKSIELIGLIEERLTQEPELRILEGHSAATEAMVIAGVVREALWLSIAAPDSDCSDALRSRLNDSLTLINDFMKGIRW